MTTATPKFRPLDRRVMAWSVLCSMAYSLILTAVLAAVDYRDARDSALQQLRFAAGSYSKSLANSVWDLDMAAVRLQLDGLASFPMVGKAVLNSGVVPRIESGTQTGRVPSDTLYWEEALVSPSDPHRAIGQLQLYVDSQALRAQLHANIFRILLGAVLQSVLLGLLVGWLIARLVTRHLSHIAAQMTARTAALGPAAIAQPLELQRSQPHHRDELDQVCTAFNRLSGELAHHFAKQHTVDEELRAHRDRLSEMVGERTRSLERLRGFQDLIIRVLTRFINLPLGHANEAVTYGLGAFGDYFGAQRCLLLTYDRALHLFNVQSAWPRSHAGADAGVSLPGELLPRRMEASAGSRVWLCGTSETTPADPLLALLETDAYTIVGIETKGAPVGLLCLTGCAIARGSESASPLELAARVTSSMLDYKTAQTTMIGTQQALQRANRELHSQSRRDALTGLANRRHLEEVKGTEFRRALRSALPLSILMCDLDEFKRYNDTYGHAQGDRCLVMFADALKELFCRAGEVPVRLGGEEFAVMLPNTDGQSALLLAERLRQAVWELNMPHASSSIAERVTVSIGVAHLKHGWHQDFDALLKEADLALYRAKQLRNRSVLAD